MTDDELMDEFLNRFGISGFMEMNKLLESNSNYRYQIDILEKKLKEALDKNQES